MTSIDALINRQLLRWELERQQGEARPPQKTLQSPIITVSRQTGSRGSYIAELLAQRLGFQRLHREAIDAISKSSGYRKRLIEALDEHIRGHLERTVEATLTGQWVDYGDYVEHLHRVVLSMAELGGVILMGRGGNFILGPLRGLHIRVICPDSARIENLVRYKQMSVPEARRHMEQGDRERRDFVAKVFHADIDSPRNYDMVLNSGLMDVDRLVDIAEIAYRAKMARLQEKRAQSQQRVV